MKLGHGQLFPDKWSACGVLVPSPPDALALPTPSKDSGAPAVAGYTAESPEWAQARVRLLYPGGHCHLFLRPINCYDDRFSSWMEFIILFHLFCICLKFSVNSFH